DWHLLPVLYQVGWESEPPQPTIGSLPAKTAWETRAEGALVMLVAVQLSVPGLYLPPVFSKQQTLFCPPQTIISLPVHTATCAFRARGAFAVLVAIQPSVFGLYLPPVFKEPMLLLEPPQTIISLPVQTAV